MSYRTFDDLREQVEMELDTEDETFVQGPEIINYFNTAVTLCEAEIIKLGLREKYLQKEFLFAAVANQADYALPADIVANKIRKVVYRNGTIIYTVRPMRGEFAPETEDVYKVYPANEYYHYQLIKVGEANVFRITPRAAVSVPVTETPGVPPTGFRMLYFGKLNRYTAEGDGVNCDVPDVCYEFIMSYVRYRIYGKETHVNTTAERADMLSLRMLMNETLQNQVADPEMDELDRDFSHYEEFS